MFFARFYRTDATNGEPTVEVDFCIVPYADVQQQHDYVVKVAVFRPEAYFYRIFEGPHLRGGVAVSLLHQLKV